MAIGDFSLGFGIHRLHPDECRNMVVASRALEKHRWTFTQTKHVTDRCCGDRKKAGSHLAKIRLIESDAGQCGFPTASGQDQAVRRQGQVVRSVALYVGRLEDSYNFLQLLTTCYNLLKLVTNIALFKCLELLYSDGGETVNTNYTFKLASS